PVNIGMAMFKVAIFLAILTPVADPARLSVSDQVARLNNGKVSVADFDWWLLKDDTGRYGQRALEALVKSNKPEIATKAQAALDDKIGERPYQGMTTEPDKVATRADLEKIPLVFPAGAKLPESFIATNFTSPNLGFLVPDCLREAEIEAERACKAALIDLNQDEVPEILIRSQGSLSIFTQVRGVWMGASSFVFIGEQENDFDAGKLSAATPQWQDLMVGEERVQVPNFPNPDVRITLPPASAVASPQPTNAVTSPSK
ncbi:MAG: hypothetical protein HC777_01335, partial [Hyphomonadaceae bacterium]|nr:hypothetical protein [Hyphomonadaceae bacterium]